MLHGLLERLCADSSKGFRYLAYGGAAHELLNPKGRPTFTDIDILTIAPLGTAIDQVKQALHAMDIKHDEDGNGNFILHMKGVCYHLQLVDLENCKDWCPGGFVRFNDSEFDASRCIQWPRAENGPPIPCVHQDFLDTRGKAFYYLGDPKTDPLAARPGVDVSAFEF